MRFRVTHHTDYTYRTPASESFAELRVWPQTTSTQRVIERRLEVTPQVPIDHYVDYFGNNVEFFSIPFRHNRLRVSAHAEVETRPEPDLARPLAVTVAEARQIFASRSYQFFDFLMPTALVPLGAAVLPLKFPPIRPDSTLGDTFFSINRWIHKSFKYVPGVTDVMTPLETVVKKRKGVCQDYAHIMLAILRLHGLPARYVSGYIEPYDPAHADASALTGAAASHAWVEAMLPGGLVLGLDPTNDQATGERHVKVAAGRDYGDVAPMRGTYKGATDQKLEVIVSLKRRGHNAKKTPPKKRRSSKKTARRQTRQKA